MVEPGAQGHAAVRLGRFAVRRSARVLIEKATEGAAHYTGQWLVIGGKVAQRGDPVVREQLADAEVRLCYGPLLRVDERRPSDSLYRAHVPYDATPQQIEAGWLVVADLVRRAMRDRGRL